MSLHTEVHLEDEICEQLPESRWLHDAGNVTEYDRERALFPADVLACSSHVTAM